MQMVPAGGRRPPPLTFGSAMVTDAQFKKFCQIVYREAGIHLTDEKRALLNARLAKRLRQKKIDAADYLKLIQSDADELKHFLDAISTNHTYFFREANSFRYLELRFKQIWCAACSSGEEPYSLAIACLEHGYRPHILATDISLSCIAKGQRAIYSKQSVANVEQPLLRKYFQRGQGQWEDHVRVKETVRQSIILVSQNTNESSRGNGKKGSGKVSHQDERFGIVSVGQENF